MMNWSAKPIENFALREIRCRGYAEGEWHDCGLVIIVPELLECQYKVRKRFDKEIYALSWTRCPAHNAAVGGVPGSFHMNGHALDQRPFDLNDLDQLEEIAREEYRFVLRRPWGLHCDIRGDRPPAGEPRA